MMQVKDFLRNSDFDVNCYVSVYDCTRLSDSWIDDAKLIYYGFGGIDLPHEVAVMDISYVTLERTNYKTTLILEAKKH